MTGIPHADWYTDEDGVNPQIAERRIKVQDERLAEGLLQRGTPVNRLLPGLFVANDNK